MQQNKPLKIPLFHLASGRKQVDERIGVSYQQLSQHVPFRHVPHRHDFYHIIWVESGMDMFVGDEKRYRIEPGTVIFVPPGQVHAWEPQESLNGYILSFEPALLFSQYNRPSRLLHELAQWSTAANDKSPVAEDTRGALRQRFEDLAREFSGNGEFRDEMLRAQITELLIFLHRIFVGPAAMESQGHLAPLTGRFLSLLEKSEGKLYRTDHYLSELLVSARALTTAVLSETGKSPSVWIRDRTLLEARRLLTYTDLTVSEIAYRLNFRNVSYFVRFYRRLTGMSPGAARAARKNGKKTESPK
jgi:AraC family transcriptional activator of pobA